MSPDGAAWWAVTIDCNDPRTVAGFWSTMFDCPVLEAGPDRVNWLRLQPHGAGGPFMNFQPVEEARVGKARLHVDVLVDDIDAAAARAVTFGATDTGAREDLLRGRIAIMRDPEGNEFCLLASPPR